MDNFSDRLTRKMNKMGYTQESLAEKVGCSHSTVSRWMAGSKPRKMAAHQLASALHTTTSWLLNGGEETEPANLKAVEALETKIATCVKQTEDAWRDFTACYAKDLLPDSLLDLSSLLVEKKPPGFEPLHTGLNALLKKKLSAKNQ